MIFAKLNKNEAGFLLLESLVTLMIIAIILTVLYPLLINWISLRQTEKIAVEQTRRMYESSALWVPDQHSSTEVNFENHKIKLDESSVKVFNSEFEVIIYESFFE